MGAAGHQGAVGALALRAEGAHLHLIVAVRVQVGELHRGHLALKHVGFGLGVPLDPVPHLLPGEGLVSGEARAPSSLDSIDLPYCPLCTVRPQGSEGRSDLRVHTAGLGGWRGAALGGGGATFQEGGKMSESSLGTCPRSPSWPSGPGKPPPQWLPASPSTSLNAPLPYPVPCWFARRGEPVEVDLPRPGGFGIGVLWGAQDTVGDWECSLGLVLEGQVQFICSG